MCCLLSLPVWLRPFAESIPAFFSHVLAPSCFWPWFLIKPCLSPACCVSFALRWLTSCVPNLYSLLTHRCSNGALPKCRTCLFVGQVVCLFVGWLVVPAWCSVTSEWFAWTKSQDLLHTSPISLSAKLCLKNKPMQMETKQPFFFRRSVSCLNSHLFTVFASLSIFSLKASHRTLPHFYPAFSRSVEEVMWFLVGVSAHEAHITVGLSPAALKLFHFHKPALVSGSAVSVPWLFSDVFCCVLPPIHSFSPFLFQLELHL